MKMSNNPAKYEVLIKQYLLSILDIVMCRGIKEKSLHLNIVCAVSGRGSSFSLWIDSEVERPEKTSLEHDFLVRTPESK